LSFLGVRLEAVGAAAPVNQLLRLEVVRNLVEL
jgi:hypothetical protein